MAPALLAESTYVAAGRLMPAARAFEKRHSGEAKLGDYPDSRPARTTATDKVYGAMEIDVEVKSNLGRVLLLVACPQ